MGVVGTVGLVLHPRRDAREAIDGILRWATDRSVEIVCLSDEVERVDATATAVPADELAKRSELIVSLGGDGTMLRAMRLAIDSDVPILGVNLGRLGFLAEVDVPDLPAALSAVDAHDYSVEGRTAVEARFLGHSKLAFNDIALVRVPGHGSAAVGLRVDGSPFVRYAADAVVVSTPTGSTAYAFAAGGPIVSPRTQGLLVVPVAPHSAFNRALLLSCDEPLTLQVLSSSSRLVVEVDGEVAGEVCEGDEVDIVVHVDAGRVVRLGRTTFYERARRKLGLTGSAQLG
jgi:NAD+ kinase